MRPRLLDLFCGALGVECTHGIDHVRALRNRLHFTAEDAAVLFDGMFQPISVGRSEDASVSSLRDGLRNHWGRGRQQAALFSGVCQESQREARVGMAGRASGDDAEVSRDPGGEESGDMARKESIRTGADHRDAGRSVRRLRCGKPRMAARRLHRDDQGIPLQAPASPCICPNPYGPVPHPVREPSLRADPHGTDRRDFYYAVGKVR